MGVYIKGMEMPTNCWSCRMFYNCYACEGHYCRCAALGEVIGKDSEVLRDKRRDDCPLVPVPPHGDLVDRAEMREIAISLLDKAVTDQEANAIREMWSRLGQMPAYIPAEEGE